jgi:hypothetical protein
MPSFQISDPSSAVKLTEAEEGGRHIARGSVPFVVENLTNVNRTTAVRVVPVSEADLAIFSIVGASPTSPAFRSIDFAARQVQTVTVAIAAPLGPAARSAAFRLRVTLESDPDNDSVESPPAAFELKAVAAPAPPPKAPFPWWAVIAAALLFLVVAGAATWLLWPKGQNLNLVGRDADELAAVFRALDGKVAAVVNVEWNEWGAGCMGEQKVTSQRQESVAHDNLQHFVFTVALGITDPCNAPRPSTWVPVQAAKVRAVQRFRQLMSGAPNIVVNAAPVPL